MRFGMEIVVAIQIDSEKKAYPVGTKAYLGALSAVVMLGAVIGLGIAVGVQGGAQTAQERTFFVDTAQASVSGQYAVRGIQDGLVAHWARPAPRLLGPASAVRLGGGAGQTGAVSSPFVQHIEHLPRPVTDALDLPPEQEGALLASTLTTLNPISASLRQTETPSGGLAFAGTGERPRIAIVLDDLGLDEKATRRAIALPRTITLSFLPYGRASRGLAEEALSRGHEIMVHIPMEPEGDADPGPNVLLVAQSADEITSRLSAQLDQFPGAVGFNNHMGSRFTADVRALLPVMREARARGLLFLDSRTTPNTLAARVAEAAGATAISRDIFLDHAQGADGLLSQLEEIEKTARLTGSAIGIAHPHDLTLEVLEVWARGLASKGIDLVPISAMATLDTGTADPDLLAASGL